MLKVTPRLSRKANPISEKRIMIQKGLIITHGRSVKKAPRAMRCSSMPGSEGK